MELLESVERERRVTTARMLISLPNGSLQPTRQTDQMLGVIWGVEWSVTQLA